MSKLAGFKIPQQFIVGFMAGVFSSVLVWLASLVGGLAQVLIAMIQDEGRSALISGTDLGTQLVQMLGGQWVLGLPEILIVGIGGGVLVMLGTYIYNMKWSPNQVPGLKPTPVTKLTLVLFYASLAATLVLTAFAIPALPAVLVLFVNSIVTAWFVVMVLGKQLKLV